MTSEKKSFSFFLIVWIGQLLSRIGSGISAFALGVHLFQKTGSAAAYSLLLLCALLPSIVFAPVGGVIADRRDRKRMMVVGDLGSALGLLFVLIMLPLYPDMNWPLYLGVAISSLFVALHDLPSKLLSLNCLRRKSTQGPAD